MTEPSVNAPMQRFTIGSCLSISSAVFLRNFLPFLVLGLIVGLPGLIMSIASNLKGAETTSGAGSFVDSGTFVSMFTNALLAATVVYGTVQNLRGRPASFGAILSHGASSIGRVTLASILSTLAIYAATLLLVIPGIMVAISLWVYLPIVVVERASVIGGFTRSGYLTWGHRWAIFGMASIPFVAFAGALFLIYFLIPDQIGGSETKTMLVQEVLSYIAVAFYGVFSAVVSAVCYYLLRAEKEGIDIDEIAKVFD